MKKIVILACCILLFLTGCNFDPYSDQRPTDYGNAIWACDEYNMWFCVDLEKEDYYNPEGELQINDDTYFCKFYFGGASWPAVLIRSRHAGSLHKPPFPLRVG